MAVIEKIRYKVDLRRYMADCDANYLRLIKLFPEHQSASTRTLAFGGQIDKVVVATVLERTPYTTLLKLEQAEGNGVNWLELPVLKVRLYHDAQVAEVVDCDGQRSPTPRFEYPNPKMYQQDEKAQWNRFLADLLAHCLRYGYEVDAGFESASS